MIFVTGFILFFIAVLISSVTDKQYKVSTTLAITGIAAMALSTCIALWRIMP